MTIKTKFNTDDDVYCIFPWSHNEVPCITRCKVIDININVNCMCTEVHYYVEESNQGVVHEVHEKFTYDTVDEAIEFFASEMRKRIK